MNRDGESQPREIRGVPPVGDAIEGGYQPQASAPADLARLKPPRGGTAIVPPQKPAPKQ